jgi:GDP-4-dehydro-6-deoxy-D-mannose reductase
VRLLITGASGFAGTHLAESCVAAGVDVVALGRRPAAAAVDDTEYIQADLAAGDDARRAVAAARADAIVHLAADVSVPRSWSEPQAMLVANPLATLKLLEAVRVESPEALVLVACSSEEYGAPERLPVTEDAPLRPQNPYAASKAASDLLAGFYADAYSLRVTRARAFNHAGPGQGEGWVVSDLARQVAVAERAGAAEVSVAIGNAAVRRDFVDVRDVARAYRALVEGRHVGVYNVCTGTSVSIAEIALGLEELSPLKVDQRSEPGLRRQNEVMEVVGSYERLSEATGWAPEVPFSRTLADTLDWWRQKLA